MASRPTARQLSRRSRKAWLLAHVITSVGWLGAGAANLVLAAVALDGEMRLEPTACYRAIHLIDTYAVIPAAFGSLGTGLVVSLGTKWGLFTHWWVLGKLVLTIVVITFSTFGLGFWIERSLGAHPGPSPHAVAIVIGATGNVIAFLGMTALSVYKPRGLVRTSRRRQPGLS